LLFSPNTITEPFILEICRDARATLFAHDIGSERRCLGPETIAARAVRPHGKIATIPTPLDRTNEGSSTQNFVQALFKPEIPAAFRDHR
jgi:hypothetical protein